MSATIFQFHKGAIRTRVDLVTAQNQSYFNSIKVRLELVRTCSMIFVRNFNSIKVRLELAAGLRRFGRGFLFQFHKGAIRTSSSSSSSSKCSNFNSIKVRLEPPRNPCAFSLIPFQFHKGAIRTAGSGGWMVSGAIFQFHKGAIRT